MSGNELMGKLFRRDIMEVYVLLRNRLPKDMVNLIMAENCIKYKKTIRKICEHFRGAILYLNNKIGGQWGFKDRKMMQKHLSYLYFVYCHPFELRGDDDEFFRNDFEKFSKDIYYSCADNRNTLWNVKNNFISKFLSELNVKLWYEKNFEPDSSDSSSGSDFSEEEW